MLRINWKNKVLVGALFFVGQGLANSQIAEGYEVATWKGFAKSAISFTLDDNSPYHYTLAQPLFDKYDFNVTFYINTQFVSNWDVLQAAVDSGHEIGSHGVTHQNLNTELLTEAEKISSLKDSKDAINANLEGYNTTTYAYPYCAADNDGMVEDYYLSARTCGIPVQNSSPSNFMRVGAAVCGGGDVNSTEKLDAVANNALARKGWAVYLFHGFDGQGYSPMDTKELEPHLSYLNDNPNDFWVESYGSVVKYIKQRDAVELVETSNTGSRFSFDISHDLAHDSIYNESLSIRREVSSAWQKSKVTQSGTEVESKLVQESGRFYLEFDVMPNRGEVVIQKSSLSPVFEKSNDKAYSLYSSSTGNQFTISGAGIDFVDVMNSKGQWVAQAKKMTSGVMVDMSNFSAGVYILKFNTLNGMVFKRVYQSK